MSYQIGDCLLDKNGTLTIPDTVDSHTAQMLLTYLVAHGYEGEAKRAADRLTLYNGPLVKTTHRKKYVNQFSPNLTLSRPESPKTDMHQTSRREAV